jgi:hypothetical protein
MLTGTHSQIRGDSAQRAILPGIENQLIAEPDTGAVVYLYSEAVDTCFEIHLARPPGREAVHR